MSVVNEQSKLSNFGRMKKNSPRFFIMLMEKDKNKSVGLGFGWPNVNDCTIWFAIFL